MTAVAQNALRDSLAEASRQLDYHPDSTDLRLKKAAWNVQLEEWETALDEYSQVLRQEASRGGTSLAALFYRAYVNERLGRYNFARLDYNNFLKVVPGNFEAQLGLALLNEKDKHYTEAMDGINRLVNQYPDSAVAYAARAGMEKERGMTELAIYDFTEAIKRDGSNVDYLLNRVDLYIRQGELGKARADLDRCVALGVSRARLGVYYEKCKK